MGALLGCAKYTSPVGAVTLAFMATLTGADVPGMLMEAVTPPLNVTPADPYAIGKLTDDCWLLNGLGRAMPTAWLYAKFRPR